jgi:hypothetical protein
VSDSVSDGGVCGEESHSIGESDGESCLSCRSVEVAMS